MQIGGKAYKSLEVVCYLYNLQAHTYITKATEFFSKVGNIREERGLSE